MTRAAEVVECTDPHFLPEDPLVVDAPSLGKHGRRFVFALAENPRTFSAITTARSREWCR